MSEIRTVEAGSSADFPHEADTSEMKRLFRRGRVGCCRTRMHKSKYFEADACHPGGMHLKRVRRYFSSATAAVRWARQVTKELRTHGTLARTLGTGQRWIASQCFLILKAIGLDSPVALLDVVREFEKTHPHGPNARTLDQLRIEVVAAKRKQGRSERHVLSLDYRLRQLTKAIGNKPVTAITTAQLQGELERHRNWNPTTIHSTVQGWKIALNYAIRHGFLVNNPANKLELPRIVHEEPVVLSLRDVRKLLAATFFSDRDPVLPECRAYLAIGMFAGLRPEKEMAHLEWSDINLDARTITVRAKTAKMRVRRIVRIEPVLAAWLAPIWRKAGLVLRMPIAVLRRSVREVIEVPRWPADVLRHTFASYHFELHQDEARTKKQLGHRDDGRIFYDHYCKPVYPADAAQFWTINPPVALIPEFSSCSLAAAA